jgi:exosortase
MSVSAARRPEHASEHTLLLRLRYLPWFRIGTILALTLLIYANVLADMARDWWNDPAWSQGMLLPPLALYIAWMQRAHTLQTEPENDRRGVALVAFACILFLLGKLASEMFTMRISFVILLAALIWTFWGLRRLQSLAFPLVLLATMVPIPTLIYNTIAAPLQLFASDIASRVSQSLGISVLREGNIIHLAGISLGVSEACSGLHSLSALVVGSLLIGYLHCARLLARLALVVVAPPLAILINVVRVAGTAVLADYNQSFAMGFYHSFSGWLVFIAGFGILHATARALSAPHEIPR